MPIWRTRVVKDLRSIWHQNALKRKLVAIEKHYMDTAYHQTRTRCRHGKSTRGLSNLRVKGGISRHRVVRSPGPFLEMLIGRHPVGRYRIAFERLESPPVFQADDIVVIDRAV
jgi:hypothetical protein